MENLLTVEILASRIHKSVSSIRSDATRNPKSLPPICRLPGNKRLLWRESDVDTWITKHVCSAEPIDTGFETDLGLTVGTKLKKRGRPTKAETIARQRQA